MDAVPLAEVLDGLESHWDSIEAQTLVDGPLLLAAWAVRVWAGSAPLDREVAARATVDYVVRTCAMRYASVSTPASTPAVLNPGPASESPCRANAFAIQTDAGAGTPLGLGLYAVAARFNHSCEPNCLASYVPHRALGDGA